LGYRNGDVLVIHNFSNASVTLPAGEVVLSSLRGMQTGHSLAPDQTVWLKLHA
jgi:predicted 2-oxoglutarate/Fe(II)-dependent dioxygenase YbiX